MAMGLQYYPPSAPDVPRGLTAPGFRHRVYAVAVLLSLFLFLLFYLALVAGAGFLVYEAFVYPIGGAGRGSLLLKLGSIAMAVMLFLFLLKGLFKRHDVDETEFTEITEAEQPELWAFIRRLCREVRAPFPYRIYIAPDVNAAVFYDTSLLNLIVPVRKNLVIGLGLVNVATLSELKAVLAHEFGHFSQSGMALGSYVQIANRVIADLVFGRDQWDETLEDWCGLDIRIAVFAWILVGVIWLLRQVLVGVFMAINLVRLALMRQMEYHADLVAASVTGSDALVHLLAKTEFARESLAQAFQDLRAASHRGRYSRDLYFHQARAGEYLRRTRKNPAFGAPPPLPPEGGAKIRLFRPVDERPSTLWASHPTHFEREENLKRRYVPAALDDRSAWLIFRDPEALRATMTIEVYQEHLGLPNGTQLSEPEEVQTLIDEEHGESGIDARYGGLYDARPIEPGDVNAIAHAVLAQPMPLQRLAQVYEQVYAGKLKPWLEEHTRRREEREFLVSVASGQVKLKGREFEFRGHRRRPSEVRTLLRNVEGELEKDREFLATLDRDVFGAHYQMARALGAGQDAELLARYQFHLQVQAINSDVRLQFLKLRSTFAALGSQRLTEGDVQRVVSLAREARNALQGHLTAAHGMVVPPMQGVTAGLPLSHSIQPSSLVPDLYTDRQLPSGEWLQSLGRQLLEVEQRASGIRVRSLVALLGLQEQIVVQYRAAANRPPAG